jgi:hypothetical protein
MNEYQPANPSGSLQNLGALYQLLPQLGAGEKLPAVRELVAQAAGLFMEVTAASQLNVVGDSLKFTVQFNNRMGIPLEMAQVGVFGSTYIFDNGKANTNNSKTASVKILKETPVSQPYWLEYPITGGSFDVRKQEQIGKPQNGSITALFQVKINGTIYEFTRPVMYKSTDPVKGELYQPVQLVHPVFLNSSPSLVIFSNNKKSEKRHLQFTLQSNTDIKEKISFHTRYNGHSNLVFDSVTSLPKNARRIIDVVLNGDSFPNNSTHYIGGQLKAASLYESQFFTLQKIAYDHIPAIYYNYYDQARIIRMDLQIAGNRVGYIAGAGDKVPQALEQMGYTVVTLDEKDITIQNLRTLDAIVTGVRAYNTNQWMAGAYEVLMNYVKEGGVLLVQYNTNNGLGPLQAKMGPYPFTVSRNRITDETAAVNFLIPGHPVLNYPNKITQKDFDGWIQERSIYNAENAANNYQRILGMKDPGEKEQDGSLIVADYGKGRFVYTGLVFFRELPAGVPGAYRLFANLIATPKPARKEILKSK